MCPLVAFTEALTMYSYNNERSGILIFYIAKKTR